MCLHAALHCICNSDHAFSGSFHIPLCTTNQVYILCCIKEESQYIPYRGFKYYHENFETHTHTHTHTPSHCSRGSALHLVLISASRICKAKNLVYWLFENSKMESTCVQASGFSRNLAITWPAICCCI